MSIASSAFTDPVAFLRDLTPERIHARLDALESERKALHVLLRSIAARDRAARRRASRPAQPTEVSHA